MIKSYDRLIADLLKSKDKGNVICLKIKGIEKAILTSVQEVRANRIVFLNPISVYGAPLDESVFHLEDIESLRVYNARYTDPVYVRIRELKNNIDEIRRTLKW